MSTKWSISLRGNSPILFNLNRMNSGHFSVYDVSDDHEAEHFFLYSRHTDGVQDQGQVVSAYKGLIELLNGASALEWGFDGLRRRGTLSIDSLYKIDAETGASKKAFDADLNVPASNPFLKVLPPRPYDAPFSYKTTGYLELSIKHEDLFHLLRLLAAGFDWRNLYCIWDTVANYSGGTKAAPKELGLDSEQINAFTGTVNNFCVLGTEARHGVGGWKVPKNIVTYEEALNIIYEVVKKYLAKKHCLNCASKRWKTS